MRMNRKRGLLSGLLAGGLIWTSVSAAPVSGAPDRSMDRLKWLFAQFGAMPKGLMVTLAAIAIVLTAAVVYYLLDVREEERENAKRQSRKKTRKSR